MIAILADIHANLPALTTVLEDLPEVSAIWVLGDTIGEMPYPCEVLDRLALVAEKTLYAHCRQQGNIFCWKRTTACITTGGPAPK